MRRRCWLVLLMVGLGGLRNPVLFADWPMWRTDAYRSGASERNLPPQLHPQWTRDFSARRPAWDDPLNLDLMTYDRVLEPIVLGDRLFLGFNDRDQVQAFDVHDGRRLWSFFADAPVRLPAVAWRDRVYFCSDDGCLYCVGAKDGRVVWRFQGAPSRQQSLGNQRLTSAWPARGGPVIRDGSVYYAASIWPMMGTFLYALDAETGAVQWVNDSTGSQYIKQPHSAPSFAGVAPQGAMSATSEHLIVPGGRSVPAVFNRHDGSLRYFEINAGGKGTGGSFVAADELRFYVHTRKKGVRAFDLQTGLKTAFMPNEPVLRDGVVYSAEERDGQPVVRAYGKDDAVLWQAPADGSGDLILAGNRLYAAGGGAISVLQLANDDSPPTVVHKIPVQGDVQRLVAGGNKLFAVTLQGALIAFGDGGAPSIEAIDEQPAPLAPPPQAAEFASTLLDACDAEGFALWFGEADSPAVEALAAASPFVQLAIVDQDVDRIAELRRRLDAADLYGRVTAHVSTAREFKAPRYIANLIVASSETGADDQALAAMYQSVRPYGGVLQLLGPADRNELADHIRELGWEQAEVQVNDLGVRVVRVGPLPGSADWTHQYGNIGNTIKSNDARVKLPLGVLWFGGSSNMDVLPRHGHGPPEQVVGGRLFVQGMNSLSARDVYTGRVLWKREFKDLGTYDVYYDDTYKDTPLDPAYNQVHIPGANGRGTNYVVAEDRIYLIEGALCHVLDPATGEILRDISLPKDEQGVQREWGYIGVYQDVLLAGLGFAKYRERHELKLASDAGLSRNRQGFGAKSLDRAASRGLIAFDRHSGEVLWTANANHSFWHNGIVAGGGKVFCLDRNPRTIEEAMRRRGIPQPESYRIVALDARRGDVKWEVSEDVFGTWLGYSEEYDLLLQAGAAASDRLYAETGEGMAVYRAQTGEVQWKDDQVKYAGPCILHHEWIITNANSYSESAGAFHLQDGRQKMVANPVTGELQPWKMTRAYGCNNIIASENLLTFRSGAAGFYDWVGDAGAGNFGGFKSGCTSNLVVANGVLNAPDYTRTCSCSYQNQTSLAMVHMPELDYWTIHPAASSKSVGQSIQHLGLNFGAPGDRRDADGTLWLEHPAVGGPSAPFSVKLNETAKYFRHHSLSGRNSDTEHAWVYASGIADITSLTLDLTLREDVGLATGLPIDHPGDDAEEQEDGSVILDSSDLELVEDTGVQVVGVRFNNIPLARGANIRRAHLQFTCDEPSDVATSLIIAGEKSANAARFAAESHNISSRSRTRAEAAWRVSPWTKAGAHDSAQRSPDLKAILQEIVNQTDWRPGNSAAFLITGAGKRVASAMQPPGTEAVRLFVDADEVELETTSEDVGAPTSCVCISQPRVIPSSAACLMSKSKAIKRCNA